MARDQGSGLCPPFAQAGVVYPPDELTLLGLKAERSLEVWALSGDSWSFIKSYPIKGASGNAGPKLREGDRQVPEGIYRIIGLNPNSSYHLSMKLNYPNEFDLQKAKGRGQIATWK
jgi:murein L,D-transpeptidase YafK